MRSVTLTTRKAIASAQKRHGLTLDGIIEKYGIHVSKGTLSRAARGLGVSRWAEGEIRRGLGLPPLRKPAHRPYITDPAKWAAYLEWSAEYDSGRAADGAKEGEA